MDQYFLNYFIGDILTEVFSFATEEEAKLYAEKLSDRFLLWIFNYKSDIYKEAYFTKDGCRYYYTIFKKLIEHESLDDHYAWNFID